VPAAAIARQETTPALIAWKSAAGRTPAAYALGPLTLVNADRA
jgi:hypothetical protein